MTTKYRPVVYDADFERERLLANIRLAAPKVPWDESKHTRAKKGVREGGRFAPKAFIGVPSKGKATQGSKQGSSSVIGQPSNPGDPFSDLAHRLFDHNGPAILSGWTKFKAFNQGDGPTLQDRYDDIELEEKLAGSLLLGMSCIQGEHIDYDLTLKAVPGMIEYGTRAIHKHRVVSDEEEGDMHYQSTVAVDRSLIDKSTHSEHHFVDTASTLVHECLGHGTERFLTKTGRMAWVNLYLKYLSMELQKPQLASANLEYITWTKAAKHPEFEEFRPTAVLPERYAGVNVQEFRATMMQTYFLAPEQFKKQYPDVTKMFKEGDAIEFVNNPYKLVGKAGCNIPAILQFLQMCR